MASITSMTSTAVPPKPPYSSGKGTPRSPISANAAHTVSLQPVGEATILARASIEYSLFRYRLRLSARSCCSSLRSKFMPSQAQRRLGDDVPLDLVGARVDRGFAHVAVARGQPRREVVEVHRVHRPEGLGQGSRRLHHLVEETQVGDLERHQLDLDPRQPVAESCVLEERPPVLHVIAGQLLEPGQLALGVADAAGAHPLVAEQVLGHRPPLALLVHEVLDGNLDLVEEDLVHLLAAVQQDDGPHRDAGRVHVDQQEGDAVLALARIRVGAHEAEDPVGVVSERGPDLLARDDVVAVLPLGARLERGQVRARARLRISLAPEVRAVVDARQEALLLGLRAELQQHGRAHPEPERHQRRSLRVATLFLEDVLLHGVPVRPAPFLRPVRRDPALLGEDPVPAQQIVLGQLLIALHLLAQLVGQVGAQPRAHLVAKRQLLDRVVQVHVTAPLCAGRRSRKRPPCYRSLAITSSAEALAAPACLGYSLSPMPDAPAGYQSQAADHHTSLRGVSPMTFPLERATPASLDLDPKSLERLLETVTRHIAEGRYPGAQIAMARRGKLALFETIGDARIDPARTQASEDTLWLLYSNTKVVTACAVWLLVERGALSFTDKVAEHLPGFEQ